MTKLPAVETDKGKSARTGGGGGGDPLTLRLLRQLQLLLQVSYNILQLFHLLGHGLLSGSLSSGSTACAHTWAGFFGWSCGCLSPFFFLHLLLLLLSNLLKEGDESGWCRSPFEVKCHQKRVTVEATSQKLLHSNIVPSFWGNSAGIKGSREVAL